MARARDGRGGRARHAACQPDDGSTRSMAARHGVGKDSVARIWRDHNLRPWRTDRFVSGGPRFEENWSTWWGCT